MLETLFAQRSQEQAFLALMTCGLVLGLLFHMGSALRSHPVWSALWDVLTAALGTGAVFTVLLKFHQQLRAYAILGLLLGALLYLAGLYQPLQALGRLLQKYKHMLRPKAGESTSGDESNVQKSEKEVS